MLNTRLRRCAQVIDARRSAGDGRSSTTLAWLPLPRFAGVTNARCLLLGANTPWKRVRLTLGFGTRAASATPVVATTDYVRALPQLIASYIEPSMMVLGTDGFGRSDTRAALRSFFEVDRFHIVLAALTALSRQGLVPTHLCKAAIKKYDINGDAVTPWEN